MNEELNIQQQEVQLEKMAIQLGLEQFRNQTDKLEQGQYASATVYGVSTIDNLINPISEHIEAQRLKVKSGRNGKDFAEVKQHLNDITSDQLSLITIKVMLDRVCDTGSDDSSILTNVYHAVGVAIERQLQLDWYEREHKELYDYVTKKYWKATTGTDQKFAVMRLMANRRDIQWNAWPRMTVIKIGNWCVDAAMQSTGWFALVMKQRGRKKVNFLEPADALIQHKADVLQVAELFTPLSYPMIAEPNPWSSDQKGGYFLNELMRQHDMVRRGDVEVISQGQMPIDFLNNLQRVKYKVNEFTAEVAEWAWEKGIKIGKFLPPTFNVPIPNKPPNIDDDPEVEQAYRRERTIAHDEQVAVAKRSVRTAKEMGVLRLFRKRGYKEFYFAWSFDYRGRVYPLNAFLTIQNTDFGKSLLLFADEAPITDSAIKWIIRHLATCYGNGVDKMSWADREDWVKANHNHIIDVATDPYSTWGYWSQADEPWQYLAACYEYYHTAVLKDKLTTGLPCGIDQSCSGIQFLSGATKDESAACYVNVLPGEVPQDAYKAVILKALEWTGKDGDQQFPPHIAPFADRSLSKRIVMTLPYNSKPDSHRKYVAAALRDLAKKHQIEFQDGDFKAVREAIVWAMDELFPNIMGCMRKIEKWAGECLKDGKKKLVWITPSGFIVSQRKDILEIHTTRLQLLGKRVKSSVPGEPLGPHIQKHRNCTSPNWIHSLDASLLHMCFHDYTKPFSVIHDCVLAPATYIDEIAERARVAYIQMFTEHDPLNDLRIALEASEDDMPEIGTLDVREVGESPYYMA